MRRVVLVALMAGLVGLVMTRTASAEDVTFVGFVKACGEDCKAGCPAIVGTKGEVNYRVVKDDNGVKLAKELNRKKVEIKGSLGEADKDGNKWLTVKEFKAVE